ncbi:carboxymuconolactone decarboxylase family protein [Streptomyces sp. NPDC005388]|uniref:carboxymuconolactone decarboxylase family protein n=1 Tax=Streptomyces sp. NPDC005388 TaxID=3156717 RepID=UPI0033B685D2
MDDRPQIQGYGLGVAPGRQPGAHAATDRRQESSHAHIGRALGAGATPDEVRAAVRVTAPFGMTRTWRASDVPDALLAEREEQEDQADARRRLILLARAKVVATVQVPRLREDAVRRAATARPDCPRDR